MGDGVKNRESGRDEDGAREEDGFGRTGPGFDAHDVATVSIEREEAFVDEETFEVDTLREDLKFGECVGVGEIGI